MKNSSDLLKNQLASLITKQSEVPKASAPMPKQRVVEGARYIRASVVLFPQDDEFVTKTIRAAADQGYRLNQSQVVRLLVRKAQNSPVTPVECAAIVAEDARRTRIRS